MKFVQHSRISALLLTLLLTGRTLEPKEISPNSIPATKRATTWLTVTKVKKPWYACRSLVSFLMEKSIPEYQAIQGLAEKYFSFWEGTDRIGGIYFWERKSDADAWFQASWFERIERQYGEKGIVDSYSILSSAEISTFPLIGEKLYAVLSYRNFDLEKNISEQENLLQIVKLQDARQKIYHLTLWKNKESALYNYSETEFDQLFFIPVFIRK